MTKTTTKKTQPEKSERTTTDYRDGPVWDEDVQCWRSHVHFPDGRRKRFKFRRKREALKWWNDQLELIDSGEYKRLFDDVTLTAVIDEYRGYSKIYHRSYKTDVSTGLAWLEKGLGGGTLIRDVTQSMIRDLTTATAAERGVHKSSYLTAEQLSVCKTIDNYLATASAFFNWCVPKYISSDPVKGVKRFRPNTERVRFLDEETEYPKFRAALPDGPWYLEALCMIGLNTGFRKGNLLGLRWDQVNFKLRIFTIESNTKNGRPFRPPMNKTAYKWLRWIHERTGQYKFVFTHTNGKFRGQRITDVKNAFHGAVKRAGIEDFHFHDMRHTFASWLVMKGVPLPAVQKLMGHRTIRMTLRYAHLAPGYLEDQVNVLDEVV